MEKTTKIKGIKKSVGTFNNHLGHAEIMLNTKTMEVFTDCFTSPNEWIEHDNHIVRIEAKGSIQMIENWNKTSMKEVRERIEYFLKHDRIDY